MKNKITMMMMIVIIIKIKPPSRHQTTFLNLSFFKITCEYGGECMKKLSKLSLKERIEDKGCSVLQMTSENSDKRRNNKSSCEPVYSVRLFPSTYLYSD